MKSGYFIGSVLGGAFVTSVLQGIYQTSSPGSCKPKPLNSGIFDIHAVENVDLLFKGELDKLKKGVPSLQIRGFEEAYGEFESELTSASEYVQTQAVMGLVMSVMAVNSYRGRSSYVPKGIAFDSILKCEEDILAIIRVEGCTDSLEKAIRALYFYLKRI